MLLENNPYPQDVRVQAEAISLARAGYVISVVAPRGAGQPRRERLQGVEVVRFRALDGSSRGRLGFVLEFASAALVLYLAAVRALLSGATVLHLHNPPDLFAGAGLIFRLAGRKVVFDHHDLFPETIEAKFGPGLAVRTAALCERLTYAVSHHVIATNESYAERARTRGRKRPQDVTVVRNAPPREWMQRGVPVRTGVLTRVTLAYLGSVSGQDGVEGLVPVLARLRRHHGLDVRLTIVGDGDARPAVQAELARHGVADRVRFTGWVDLDRVPDLLAEADICVDPAPATYVNEHSSMMKVAEYLALGKPVVAYELLETRRTTGQAARLVTPGDSDAFADAVAELAADPGARERLAAAAVARADALTWEHSERALLSAYENLRPG
ncbi:MAG: hypothetical protein QOG59_211 [Solirubrobacteraceae bacterium]|nr:hypothetical protein [Solirubrobacteraceae bacterium]